MRVLSVRGHLEGYVGQQILHFQVFFLVKDERSHGQGVCANRRDEQDGNCGQDLPRGAEDPKLFYRSDIRQHQRAKGGRRPPPHVGQQQRRIVIEPHRQNAMIYDDAPRVVPILREVSRLPRRLGYHLGPE